MDYEVMMNGNVKIGQFAPDFEAVTTMGNISLNDYKGKWVVLFSHPRRFYTCVHYRNYCFCKSRYIF
jgi:peroxiredoxin (alkyl hydroperoxide reductase subunit C)